jgi:DNA-binding transcriptional LysR family regulator
VTLEIISDDRFVDLVEEGYDVAIRITRLEDSGLDRTQLSAFSLIACASPEFLEEIWPDHPSIAIGGCPLYHRHQWPFLNNWRFDNPDGSSACGDGFRRLEVNSPLAAMRAAEAGMGVAILPDFVFRGSVRRPAHSSPS